MRARSGFAAVLRRQDGRDLLRRFPAAVFQPLFEDGVQAIERGVASGCKKVEDKFIGGFWAEEGATTEEAGAG